MKKDAKRMDLKILFMFFSGITHTQPTEQGENPCSSGLCGYLCHSSGYLKGNSVYYYG